jgi:dipeptidyl aminopeptidase/acylaminoacyl peptidase
MTATLGRAVFARYLLAGTSLCASVFAAPLAAPLLAQNSQNTQTASIANGPWDPQQILRTETYVKPPAVIERIIMAPRVDISFTTPSPDRKWFLRTPGFDRGDIDKFGAAHVNLGGLQIDTKANRARTLTTSLHTGLQLVDPRTGATRTIETPKGASVSSPAWSPNGTQIAYIANFEDASQVYVADVASGKSVAITKTPLVATLVTDLDWTGDGKNIITVLVPDGRGPAPMHGKANGVETGPQVRLTESRPSPQVIHPSLLEDPHDKAMLKYYTTGQLALIDVKSKAVKKIGSPAMIKAVDASPDGQYFRVTMMTEPFSYIVPTSSFGSVQELWDANGKTLATLTRNPLREYASTDPGDAPAGRGAQQTASDTGKRAIQWNPTGPGLVYLQSVFSGGAQSGAASGRGGRGAPAGGRGAQGRPQPTAVKFMAWLPPYGPNDTKELYSGSGRLSSVAFGTDAKTMFVADSGAVFAVRVANPSQRFKLDPGVTLPAGGGFGGRGGGAGAGAAADSVAGGALAMKRAPSGEQEVVVGSDGKTVFLSGTRQPGARWNSEGPRPWMDKLNFETDQRSRFFESAADSYDVMVAPLDDDYSSYIYTHEAPSVIRDAYLKDTKTGATKKLTENKDVAPEITQAQHKRFQVTRPRDGVKFWVDATMPRDWKPGSHAPGLIWFYPREYTTQLEYDRSRYSTNINTFPDLEPARPASSVKLWVTQGYVLLEPDSPIMGDSGKMNNNYSRDLKENLDAVIDAAVDMGLVDRDKMGLGGHSYGAFSTVNGLTLTPYFKAGIAGDGMYNRSLTPFGFQSERRNFFEAQDVYLDMSPFYRADKIHGALLMYHALEDQNVGTAPISSIRMFHALQGLGKPAALYMYPYEDHSDATYATDLDLWARWVAWFDTYVKNPAKVTP